MSQTTKVSLILQDLASHISSTLETAAGEPIAFVLVMQTDGVAQYVANTQRGDGVLLLQSLFARWKVGRADIPAHVNPDLRAATPEQRQRALQLVEDWHEGVPAGELTDWGSRAAGLIAELTKCLEVR